MSKKKKKKSNKKKSISKRIPSTPYVEDAITILSSICKIEQLAYKDNINFILAMRELRNTLNKLEKRSDEIFSKYKEIASAIQPSNTDDIFFKILRGEDISSKDILGNGLTERK